MFKDNVRRDNVRMRIVLSRKRILQLSSAGFLFPSSLQESVVSSRVVLNSSLY